MATTARASLEALLRARKLDGTLTSTMPSGGCDPQMLAPTGIEVLDARLRGGLPRGELSELAGPRSSGRTSLLCTMLAAATRRGELAALVDAFDMFDPGSAAASGVELSRLLWIRGQSVSAGPSFASPGPGPTLHPVGPARDYAFRLDRGAAGPTRNPADTPGRGLAGRYDAAIDKALKALNILLQGGGFGFVALDWAEAPAASIRRLPFTTWLRLQRVIEAGSTVCVLVGPEPVARSAGGVTIALKAIQTPISSVKAATPARPNAPVSTDRTQRLLAGLDVEARLIQARPGPDKPVHLSLGAPDLSPGAPHVQRHGG
jgi:hypothetical protein